VREVESMCAHLPVILASVFFGLDDDPTKTGPERNKENARKMVQAVKDGKEGKFPFEVFVVDEWEFPDLGRADWEMEFTPFAATETKQIFGGRETLKALSEGTATMKFMFPNGGEMNKKFSVTAEFKFIKKK
jgi:hypothetical protein